MAGEWGRVCKNVNWALYGGRINKVSRDGQWGGEDDLGRADLGIPVSGALRDIQKEPGDREEERSQDHGWD